MSKKKELDFENKNELYLRYIKLCLNIMYSFIKNQQNLYGTGATMQAENYLEQKNREDLQQSSQD